MKKYVRQIAMGLVLILLVGCLLGCEPKIPNENSGAVVKIEHREGDSTTLTEVFHIENGIAYSFPGSECHLYIVHYEDGSQEHIGKALAAGRITIADLDKYKVDYDSYPADGDSYIYYDQYLNKIGK